MGFTSLRAWVAWSSRESDAEGTEEWPGWKTPVTSDCSPGAGSGAYLMETAVLAQESSQPCGLCSDKPLALRCSASTSDG